MGINHPAFAGALNGSHLRRFTKSKKMALSKEQIALVHMDQRVFFIIRENNSLGGRSVEFMLQIVELT